MSARKACQCVKILPDSTEKDPKDTSDRVFNKLARGLFYGTEGVAGSAWRVLLVQEYSRVPAPCALVGGELNSSCNDGQIFSMMQS